MLVPRFSSLAEYGRYFNDASYWRPYVAEICNRHGIAPTQHIEAGLPGTFPVLIVDQRYVIKLFGAQFDGLRRFELELAVYRLLPSATQFAAPALLGSGRLFPAEDEWSWPYLIIGTLAGRSFGEDRAQVSFADQQAVVCWVGEQLRLLYALDLPRSGELQPSWQGFVGFVEQRSRECVATHARWGSLPRHLLEQIPAYLLPVEALVERLSPPRLLHCDLNEDHVLGVFDAAHWRPSGIIDFADVMVGDPLYDLVALHVGLTHCDKQLLRGFLDAGGLELHKHPRFVQRAMCYTLLFEFDVLGQVFSEHPAARELPGLAELAAWMWELEPLAET